jgi:hypothetical protein
MLAILAVASLLTLGGGLLGWFAQQNPTPPGKAETHKLSGPYAHDNLTIFLIHGEDRLKGRKFMLLGEALEKKLFAIYETQSVNQLSMENLSPTEEVLILSGDILKGGQQDRIAQHDQFLPPKSGKVPLAVFCVEHTAGRWMRKMTEDDKKFHASPGCLSNNSIRLANRCDASQSGVWKEVAKAQADLSRNVGKDVKAKESDSSLALSLQAKEVQAAIEKYVAGLQPILKDKNDVIGFAFAINGKPVMADVYGSPGLFEKIWPRLVRASAIEAVAELRKDGKIEPVTLAAVRSFLDEADKGKAETKDVGKGVQQITNSAKGAIRFESKLQDAKKDGGELLLRQNYLAK